MRRVLSVLLLLCLGILFPLGASPVRLCLLENRLLIGDAPDCGTEKTPCCPDCGTDDESCCIGMDGLPDASTVPEPPSLPPVPAVEVPALAFAAPPADSADVPRSVRPAPIRGPDSPGTRRALLEIWRL